MAERAALAVEPLGPWSAADDGPLRRSTFSTSGTTSLLDLAAEAGRIGATIVDVELDVEPDAIYADGRGLRKGRTGPRSGRVRVTLRFGDARPPMVLRTSNVTGDNAAPWECSLRSIVATLESLRAVDRYGVLNAGEQYEGLKALPAGTAMGAADGDGQTRDTGWARRELVEMTGMAADSSLGDLLRGARYLASDEASRERLAKVRGVISGQEAREEREAFERWRAEQDDRPTAIGMGESSGR